MAETKTQATQSDQPEQAGRRKIVVGEVVSSRMHKTIVVQVVRKKAHPFYKRVVAKAKKFYAHDEKNVARVGDVVRLEETRPLSKLRRRCCRKPRFLKPARPKGAEEIRLWL